MNGIEPSTFRSQSERATKLRHTPVCDPYRIDKLLSNKMSRHKRSEFELAHVNEELRLLRRELPILERDLSEETEDLLDVPEEFQTLLVSLETFRLWMLRKPFLQPEDQRSAFSRIHGVVDAVMDALRQNLTIGTPLRRRLAAFGKVLLGVAKNLR